MALEKPIIKANVAHETTFDYRPPEFAQAQSLAAKNYVDVDSQRSPDFKISKLVSAQAGIAQLENEAQVEKINGQVLARIRENQEKAFEEGYEIGLIEGTEKAFQESKAGLVVKVAALDALFKRVENLKAQLLLDHEAELIRLVFLIAKKIALRDLEGNREAVKEILVNVIGEAKADERVVVHLSPGDLQFIQAIQEKAGAPIASLERIKFIPQTSVKSGGCLIETEYGSVDATVEERVERTWQTLLTRIPHKPPGGQE